MEGALTAEMEKRGLRKGKNFSDSWFVCFSGHFFLLSSVCGLGCLAGRSVCTLLSLETAVAVVVVV